ncbi:MAG: glutamyl-tRNA reductase [Verrucomicrobiota bacterium]
MNVFCLGISHETAPVEVRERLAIPEREQPDALQDLLGRSPISEALILSTCNRVEVYLGVESPGKNQALLDSARTWMQGHFDLPDPVLDRSLYLRQEKEAVLHLFSVASGLESMVLGETEIFGQVKAAYRTAHGASATGKQLNQLFQKAFHVGKQIRTQTQITRGATSVGAVGVDLAEKIFGNLTKCHILILGAGKMSRRTVQSLQSRGAKSVIVSNRSYDRAVGLAAEVNGRAIRFDEWDAELPGVDIIISSTAAPHAVITQEKIRPFLKARKGRPLFLIDLSVPRDIESALRELENVYLFDIDTLQDLARSGRKSREKQVITCREMIGRHVDQFFDGSRQERRSEGEGPRRSGNSNPLTES